MLPSPGFCPNMVAPPVVALDFSALTVLNAPWPAEISSAATAASNYVDSASAALSESLAVAAQSATNYTDAAVADKLTRAEAFAGFSDWVFPSLPSDVVSIGSPYRYAQNWSVDYDYMRPNGTVAHTTTVASPVAGEYATNLVFRFGLNSTKYPAYRAKLFWGADIDALADKKADFRQVKCVYKVTNSGSTTNKLYKIEGAMFGGAQVYGDTPTTTTNSASFVTCSDDEVAVWSHLYGSMYMQEPQVAPMPGDVTDEMMRCVFATCSILVVFEKVVYESAIDASLAVAAQSATNYTDSASAALSQSLAVAAQSATNYTDSTASSLYPKSQGETLATQVAAIGAVLNGEDARFVVTNYDSVVHTPEAYVEVQVSNEWLRVWREGARWDKFEAENHVFKTNVTAELAHKADRAWGAYDSETGGYAPDGYTQLSSSNILVASGMAYQRTVTSDGAVWVLQCNSGVATIGGSTNGAFRVIDGDGETQFEIVQGDKRVIGADADGISVSGSTCTITYSVIADSHPILEITGDLQTPNWKAETDDDCIATVDWSGTSGAYVATVQRKSPGPSLFVKASYMAGGETYIRNIAPVKFDGGVLCTDGVHKVRPVYNNGSITWEVVQ